VKINIELLKKNVLLIIIGIAVVILLLFFNGLVINKKQKEESLQDQDIEINKLVINEILTSNKGVFVDEFGDSYDYIELYNGTNKDINLLNYGLSDREDGKIKWLFPDVLIKSNSYLIINLSGEKKDGLYASFSLKEEGGELVTLKKPNGKVVDTVKTVELDNNFSMSRNYNGEWIVTDEITPGHENTEKGRNEIVVASIDLEDKSLVISEVLPANEGNVIFDDDKLYSYVEVTNVSDKSIDLSKYYLSNTEKALYKWRFPNVVLKPSESYTVYMNKKNYSNNASFELKHKVDKIILSTKDGVIEKLQYEDLENGMAYIKDIDLDKWYISSDISPDFINKTEGKIEYQKKYETLKNDLIINEVMNSNNKYLSQNGNQFYDWIELYNNTDHEIYLKEYTISTDKEDKNMFKLPDVVLKPNNYYILMASGDTTLSNNAYVHTNFKLSSKEGLLLYKNGELIDSIFINEIPRGYSYGKGNEYGNMFFQIPTPNEKNDDNGIRQLSMNPTFSKESGIYNDITSLEVAINSLGNVYYTTDGSIPNENSIKYTEPIIIDKTSVIKAVSYENNKVNSNVVTKSYIINENHSLPVVSLTIEKNDFDMIIRDPWANKTVNSHVEFFEDNSSFSIDCGVKVFGGESRNYKKKNFALKFNKDYGGSLHYKMFANKDIYEFNDLVLRGGTQEQNYSMIRDEFISLMTVNYTDVAAQSARPAAFYVNGEYYGLFFIREKINNNFILNNYNVLGTTDIINSAHNRVENGTGDNYFTLRNFAANNDLSIDKNYEYVSEILDIDNYIDYYILQYIICNHDWHNVRMFSNSNIDNGKFKMILYDSDFGLKTNGGTYYFTFIQYPFIVWELQPNVILSGLFKNNNFKKRFVERMSYFMKNVWTVEHINETYDYLYNSIYKEMERESKRWGRSYENWKNQVAKVKTIALQRVESVPKYTRDYFNLNTEEYNEYFG